jgi:hypothetical protein
MSTVPRAEYDAMVAMLTATIKDLTNRIHTMEEKWAEWEAQEEPCEEEDEPCEEENELREFLAPYVEEASGREVVTQKWIFRINTNMPYKKWPKLLLLLGLEGVQLDQPDPEENWLVLYYYGPNTVRFSYNGQDGETVNVDFQIADAHLTILREFVGDDEEDFEQDVGFMFNMNNVSYLTLDVSERKDNDTKFVEHLKSIPPSRLVKVSREAFVDFFKTLFKLAVKLNCSWSRNDEEVDVKDLCNELGECLEDEFGRENLVEMVRKLRENW